MTDPQKEASVALNAIMAKARKKLPRLHAAQQLIGQHEGFGPDPEVVGAIQAARSKKRRRITL